jgi:surface carbohydrate biosynthesis protein (TIGR04326 family)
VLCWQSYQQGERIVSVPRYLEQHAERLRGRYLAFIHDLGECRIAGKRIIDHLDLGDGFSFWWLTQVAEKSPFKSPRIYDCLRLLSLEEMLLERRPVHLTLNSADRALARAIGGLCADMRISFSYEAMAVESGRWSLRALYESLPQPLRALLSLRHVLRRWPLRRSRPPRWFAGDGALFICSYFIHLDPERCGRGQFHSRQWEDLPKTVHGRGGRINWLQLFLFSAAVPTIRRGVAWLRSFNADADTQGCQAFLEHYLTVGRVMSALALWLRLIWIAWRLRGVHAAFRPHGSSAWLWPLLQQDWRSSVVGPIALGNCLAVVLFDATLAELPRQKTGLYLYENQPWEKALLRAWRRHGHGEIVGVQHATAPFWHLYYFDDRRSLSQLASGSFPLPDRVAVNGRDAWQAFTAAGFPTERLVAVEALRYLQLAALRDHATRSQQPVRSGSARTSARRVLVLGDIVPRSTHHLLQLLQGAAKLLSPEWRFTFKPHPGFSPDLAAYPGLHAAETREALGSVLGDHEVAVAANSTTAAVDAFVAGLPVIVTLDGDTLNLSPLRGRLGACFAGTAEELAESLQLSARDTRSTEHQDFFFLDPELPRWRELLGLTGGGKPAPRPQPACGGAAAPSELS